MKNINDLFVPIFHFIGEKELNKKDYKNGDICHNGVFDTFEFYSNGKWETITIDNNNEQITKNTSYQVKKMLPKICKCCGAPLKGWKCEYCEVEYD